MFYDPMDTTNLIIQSNVRLQKMLTENLKPPSKNVLLEGAGALAGIGGFFYRYMAKQAMKVEKARKRAEQMAWAATQLRKQQEQRARCRRQEAETCAARSSTPNVAAWPRSRASRAAATTSTSSSSAPSSPSSAPRAVSAAAPAARCGGKKRRRPALPGVVVEHERLRGAHSVAFTPRPSRTTAASTRASA
jgi:hypothetical protein